MMSASGRSSPGMAAISSSGSLVQGATRSISVASTHSNFSNSNVTSNTALFREIHKNTWLKRLSADGKKVTVGPKKSEKTWVVFCIHDDTWALLEGYAEPRQASSHNPEWIISMQGAQHISHTLIPNSHEFEFVVTLSNEVVRFHATSWEIMQEWVETLRSKLREMKILSPRENLYTKLPEARAPLLSTRDPTSPLPAPPPVPAAVVPGIEHLPSNIIHSVNTVSIETTPTTTMSTVVALSPDEAATKTAPEETINSSFPSTSLPSISRPTLDITSMSNTLTQNLLNMLTSPIAAYSEHMHENTITEATSNTESVIADVHEKENFASTTPCNPSNLEKITNDQKTTIHPSCSRSMECLNEVSPLNENSIRVDINSTSGSLLCDQDQRTFDDCMPSERRISGLQSTRSHSVGAVDDVKKQLPRTSQYHHHHYQQQQQQQRSGGSGGGDGNNVNYRADQIHNNNSNITELQINTTTTATASSTTTASESEATKSNANTTTNITIIQVTNISEPEPLNYFSGKTVNTLSVGDDTFQLGDEPMTGDGGIDGRKNKEYKCNVQIVPAIIQSGGNTAASRTMHVSAAQAAIDGHQCVGPSNANNTVQQQCTSFIESTVLPLCALASSANSSSAMKLENAKCSSVESSTMSTTPAIYGTCFATHKSSTPILPKKIILSANTFGVTNITVSNDIERMAATEAATQQNTKATEGGGNTYEKLSLTTSSPPPITTQSNPSSVSGVRENFNCTPRSPLASKRNGRLNSPRCQVQVAAPYSRSDQLQRVTIAASSSSAIPPPSTSSSSSIAEKKPAPAVLKKQKSMIVGQPTTSIITATTPTTVQLSQMRNFVKHSKIASPLPLAASIPPFQSISQDPNSSSATTAAVMASNQSFHDVLSTSKHARLFTRGLTEASITARPSRRDFFPKKMTTATRSKLMGNCTDTTTTCNNNDDVITATPPTKIGELNAHGSHAMSGGDGNMRSQSPDHRARSSSTSAASSGRIRMLNNNDIVPNRIANNAARMQKQPPSHNYRPAENGLQYGMTSAVVAASPVSKRLTLREQQVMQLRREIMHPGGVRLQLRRKDCVGSIAWVDAFDAIWVAGWKQKECPVLYNALHIGDQLISIAGASISSASEANKIIRNTNTVFVEVLIRRVPFGCGYAIRRDREGQCLGLIRDGNTATIVDVVPNSLAARHGLPPKAQSCDGSTLTFWVLTEINARTLNLYFKENEIHDRLNCVGRDISILVQPSDLITKLKKQLKSLRGYKDYLVQ